MLCWLAMLEERTRQSQNTLNATIYSGQIFKMMQERIQAQISLNYSGLTSTLLQIPVNGVVCRAKWKIQVALSLMCRRGEFAFCYRPAINICLFIKQNQSYENE